MSKHDERQFAVLGLGRFGLSLAKTLSENGYEVLGVDSDHDLVQEASEFCTHAVLADITDEHALRSLSIGNFDVVIIAMSSDLESAILGTLIAKEEGVKYVLARANNNTEVKILEKIGADRIIRPEMEMGERVGLSIISGNILDTLELSVDYSIVEIQPLDEWINKKIKDINIRSVYGLNVIAINRSNNITAIIEPSIEIWENDILVAIGDKSSINKFMKKSAEKYDKRNE